MATPIHGIRPPPPLNLDSNVAVNWKLFKQKWKNYSIITQLEKQDMPYQIALLLHTLGDDGLTVYNGFHFQTPESDRTVKEITDRFDQFAVGEINETYERFVFNRRVQKENESFETFLAAIRTAVKTCNYCANCVDSILRDRIVLGVQDSATQTALLKERDLTLDRCVDICKAAENANAQFRIFHPDSVNKITASKSSKATATPGPRCNESPNLHRPSMQRCKFCGRNHVMKKEECPAWGKTCSVCSRRNHFAIVCSSKPATQKKIFGKPVHQVTEDTSSDDEWINSVGAPGSKDVKCNMLVGDATVTFQIDTGASVNILPVQYADKTTPTTKKLKMWNGTELSPVGICRRSIRNPKNNKKYSIEFVVVEQDFTPLLGLKTAEQMKLITVNSDHVDRVAGVSLIEKYPDLFDGKLGTLPGSHHLCVDETVTPVVMPSRRIPIALRPKLKNELDRLTELGVITPVDEPTPWVSQIVITKKKSGDLRVCIDPKELNKALLREHYTLPILEDSLHEMSQSRMFSKADLSSGYWHIQLDDESSMLTAFQTCFGRYRWLRLPFGITVASEIFQKKLLDAFEGLPGIICVSDDITIHGRTESDHDVNLETFLARCQQKGIKLNKDKLAHKMTEIPFMGHMITSEGLRSDPEKVRAIREMVPPSNVEELRRYLGVVNYLAKFLDHITDIVEPLRNLTKQDVPWIWSDVQQNAFETVKELVTKAPVLVFYDQNKELTLENDASGYGLGSVLFQDGKPVAFASRVLTDCERRYAQIEKEMLAVSYGLDKFYHYTYGRHVNVITDHKPLVSIVKKPLSKAPKRLQALLLRTQEYNFSLTYQSGKSIPVADALSRSPLNDEPLAEPLGVNNVSFLPINRDRLNDIRTATQHDQTMMCLKATIMAGWPDTKQLLSPTLAPYYSYRDELTVQDGIILRGDRVVIPSSMRSEIKQKVHAGHSGINSCLRRARDLVFWPGMSSDIRQFVESCDTCATYAYKQPPEPLYMHEVPSRPWEKVGTDMFEIRGRHYLIVVDYYSGFFEVDYLTETTSETVVNKIKHHFARHGIPDTLISDGGPQYTARTFKQFSEKWGFKHEFSSPGNSRANGAAEAAVKIAKRLMTKCKAAGDDPYLGLLNLRNTPTEGLKTSPAQRLMGRQTKTLVPVTSEKLKPFTHHAENEKCLMENKKSKVAQYYDQRANLTRLKEGDAVRMQPIETGKKEWTAATVSKQLKSRTYEVTTATGRQYRRNRQFLRASVQSRDTVSPQSAEHQQISLPPAEPQQISGPPYVPELSELNTGRAINDVHNSDTVIYMKNDIPYKTRSGRMVKTTEKLNL